MYKGHFILLMVLTSILLISLFLSQWKKRIFIYTCWGISIIFFMISLRYYYDVFIYNPTEDGFALTWSMYFLTQNEDFLHINGEMFGLFWGVGIMGVSFILGMIWLKYHNKKYEL